MTQPDRIDHNPALVPPIQPGQPPQKPAAPGKTEDGKTFDELFRSKVADRLATTPAATPEPKAPEVSVRFSAHAEARLRQRGIELTDAQLARLENAFDRAAAKGARDALVMMDDTAMVASIRNRTVITALTTEQARDNVFTNIDSAVIA